MTGVLKILVPGTGWVPASSTGPAGADANPADHWNSAWGVIGVGTMVANGVLTGTAQAVTLPLTVTTLLGRRYRLKFQMRAAAPAAAGASGMQLQVYVDGAPVTDWYVTLPTQVPQYGSTDWSTVIDGNGASHTYAIWAKAQTVNANFYLDGCKFYIEDIGPIARIPDRSQPPADWTPYDTRYVNIDGDTMTGQLRIYGTNEAFTLDAPAGQPSYMGIWQAGTRKAYIGMYPGDGTINVVADNGDLNLQANGGGKLIKLGGPTNLAGYLIATGNLEGWDIYSRGSINQTNAGGGITSAGSISAAASITANGNGVYVPTGVLSCGVNPWANQSGAMLQPQGFLIMYMTDPNKDFASIASQRTGAASANGQPHIQFCRAGTPGAAAAVNGSITISASNAVAYNTTSDRRLKENDRSLDPDDALAKVAAMEPITFQWIGAPEDEGEQVGFIAQDLYEIAPEAVTPGRGELGDPAPCGPEDPAGFVPWMMDPGKLVPTLVAAIQSLTARNDALEARLAALEGAAA